jgi:hypothetical protein
VQNLRSDAAKPFSASFTQDLRKVSQNLKELRQHGVNYAEKVL